MKKIFALVFVSLFFLISFISAAHSISERDLDKCPKVNSQSMKSEVTPKLEINSLLGQVLLTSFEALKTVNSDPYVCCGCKCFSINPPRCCWSCECDE